MARALAAYRPLRWLREPATLEGGDVMRIGRTLYVGVSHRTNRAGIEQLADEVAPLGYSIEPVAVRGALHLKTACCPLGDGAILANREWLDIEKAGQRMCWRLAARSSCRPAFRGRRIYWRAGVCGCGRWTYRN